MSETTQADMAREQGSFTEAELIERMKEISDVFSTVKMHTVTCAKLKFELGTISPIRVQPLGSISVVIDDDVPIGEFRFE